MTFERWLQVRLNIHGAAIDEDGDWGRNSIAALKTFQRRSGLPVSAVADPATVVALRRDPATGAAAVVEPTAPMPPWMAEMHRRMGLHEVSNNSMLQKFLRIGSYLGNPANLPWCGDAVESCFAKVLPDEPLPSNPFFAQNWRHFGRDVVVPAVGSVGVIRWSASAGHIGFVAGVSGSRVNLLGGNQSNAINIRSFPRSAFIAFRWPVSFPVQSYPALKGDAVTPAGYDTTR